MPAIKSTQNCMEPPFFKKAALFLPLDLPKKQTIQAK
jgi:hypothetical protein